ncbi:TonB-dependent receptor [Lysobacter pythonis]|uniref:TonB-dependent receptor n=1 Tax=Solilutibacter pythonis TaxID=2483112 RepID=A0A3M2I3J0_9GAMM|nr:TonB-dependent receptor [Lysobacter pythonis]RMH94169.1 TonB-dependent receptor [Lysobacter pythonis]
MTPRLLASAILAALAPGAFTQQNTPTETGKHTLDQVIVTGTRASHRTVAESTAPIDVLTPETLESTGTTELATALSRALPSLNFPRPALTDGTSAIRPAQLRGLSPDQVLVLVNGKRRHTSSLLNLNGTIGRGSAPVDLNTIPISAIERVEVLRDGASAQYGSDAIAGVVNVILKNADHGGGIAFGNGRTTAGDGERFQLSGNAGLALGGEGRGFAHVSAQLGTQERTDRARPYAGAPGANQPAVGQKAFVIGDPAASFGALSVNTGYKLGDNLTLYGWGAASHRDITSYAFFRAPGNARQNILSIYPDGYLPQINNISKDRSAVIGLRGVIGGDWDWDLGYNYGQNQLLFHTRNTLNASLGPTSPRAFYAGMLETTQNVVNLDIRKGFDIGLAAPLNVAFGAEYRYDKWNQSPGEYGAYAQPNPAKPGGAQGFAGFAPAVSGHYDRKSQAAYLDVEADLTDKFNLGGAVRHERFSDFGGKTSGKVSARYAFTPAVALRGTLSTGFRAPSLPQQYFQTVSTTYLPGIATPFEIRTFPAASAIARAFGAEPLKPETSRSASLGLVLQPASGLYVTIDAYQIDVDDRIVLSSNLTGEAVRTLLESKGIYGINGGRYFTNAIGTRSRGVDVVGTYRWQMAASALDFTLGYNLGRTEITRIAPNPEALRQNGLNLERIDRVEIGRIEKGFPRDKLLLSGLWSNARWDLSLSATRYGSVGVTPNNPALDQTHGAKWLTDLAASYKLGGWKFTLGADNVFDVYPDENNFGNSTNGQFPYSNLSPFGFNGAYVYGKVAFKW